MLKELLGESWKDDITVEEIQEALKDRQLVDKKSLPKTVTKATFDKTASELASLKKELRELQQSSMTAEEQLQIAMDEANALKDQYTRDISRLRVKEVFTESGLREDDYKDVIDTLVSDDETVSLERATKIVQMMKAREELVEKAVREQLLKDTPKPDGGDPKVPVDPKAKARKHYEALAKKVRENPTDQSLQQQLFIAKENL